MKVYCLIALLATIGAARGGYAPKESPKLPDGFCPKETGTATATTGGTKLTRIMCFFSIVQVSFWKFIFSKTWNVECMCDWQHKDGCVGSACQYQYGLSFYHYRWVHSNIIISMYDDNVSTCLLEMLSHNCFSFDFIFYSSCRDCRCVAKPSSWEAGVSWHNKMQ